MERIREKGDGENREEMETTEVEKEREGERGRRLLKPQFALIGCGLKLNIISWKVNSLFPLVGLQPKETESNCVVAMRRQHSQFPRRQSRVQKVLIRNTTGTLASQMKTAAVYC